MAALAHRLVIVEHHIVLLQQRVLHHSELISSCCGAHQRRKQWGKQAGAWHAASAAQPNTYPGGARHRHLPDACLYRWLSQTQEIYKMQVKEKQCGFPLSTSSEIKKPSSIFPCTYLLRNQIFIGN